MTKAEILKLAESNEAHSFQHPCAETCSGRTQGIGAGKAQENARLLPLIEALADVAEAADNQIEQNIFLRAALAKLKELRK
jgi:hypothetical protein